MRASLVKALKDESIASGIRGDLLNYAIWTKGWPKRTTDALELGDVDGVRESLIGVEFGNDEVGCRDGPSVEIAGTIWVDVKTVCAGNLAAPDGCQADSV